MNIYAPGKLYFENRMVESQIKSVNEDQRKTGL